MAFILPCLGKYSLGNKRPILNHFVCWDSQGSFCCWEFENFDAIMIRFSHTNHFNGFLSVFRINQRRVLSFEDFFLKQTKTGRLWLSKTGKTLRPITFQCRLAPFRLNMQTNSRRLCFSHDSGSSIPTNTTSSQFFKPFTKHQPNH